MGSLREEIEGLRKHATRCTCYICETLDNVLSLAEKHQWKLIEDLHALKADDSLPLDRRIGYSLAIEDALKVVTGRITRDNVSPRGENRPARERLLAPQQNMFPEDIRAAAIVEAIDALAKRLDRS